MAFDVNEATQEELEALPGVGPATAEKLMKARPVADAKELERLLPPSAWLKIQEKGMEFVFGGDPAIAAAPPAALEVTPVAIPEPVIKMHDPNPVEMRRLVPGRELKAGAEYLCIWNTSHGPHGEAWVPEDQPVQQEIATWFETKGMTLKFAHYGPSIRLGTSSRGMVNLVLFEIVKKEDITNADGQGHKEGD